MKTISCIILLTVILLSCGRGYKSGLKNKGVLQIANGYNKLDSVKYVCDSCEKYLSQNSFDSLIAEATMDAKKSLNNPLSFVPTSINIKISKEDSLTYFDTNKNVDSCVAAYVEYKCIGKNAYGVENEVKSTSAIYLINDKIVDLYEKLKKIPLKFLDGNVVNRDLIAFDDNEYLDVFPTIRKSTSSLWLIVKSSESCVDKGARFTIKFENDDELEWKNWNDFNCKGTSYYTLSKNDLTKLKAEKIKYISLYTDKLTFCRVKHNDADYFIQWVNLLEK